MAVMGIDYGTSYSTACWWNPKTGVPEVIRNEHGDEKTPSVVFRGTAETLVGKAALDQLAESAHMSPGDQTQVQGRTFKSAKLLLKDNVPLALPDGSVVTPVELAADVLGHLKRAAEQNCFHEPVKGLVLTHPVVFTKRERDRLKEAAELAGFDDVTLLEEPVAAVLGYAASGAPVGKGVLVYDLGGGTLDLAFVKHEDDGGYRVPVESMGDSNCAGDVFDQILYGHWERESSPQIGPGFGTGDESVNLPVLMECRKSKEKLSSAARASLSYLAPQLNTHMVLGIGRKDFERLIEDRVQLTVGLTKSFLARVEATGEKVDTVLLIGGSTRIPLVRHELEKVLPVKPIETMHTDVAVAMGAAVVGEDKTRLLGDGQFKVAAGNQRNVVCPACKGRNPEEARFCEECGAALTRLCLECGRENPIQKRYCSSCGTGWEVFLKLQEALQAAEQLGKQGKWKEAKEAVSAFAEMNLPGEKGKQLVAGVRSMLKKATDCIAAAEAQRKRAVMLQTGAVKAIEAAEWQSALELIEQCRELDPERNGDWDQLAATARDGLEARTYEDASVRARACEGSLDLMPAREAWKGCLSGNPSPQYAQKARAELERIEGRIKESEVLSAAGDALWADGRWEEAIEKWTAANAIERSPERETLIESTREKVNAREELWRQATAAFQGKDYQKAIRLFAAITKMRPGDERARSQHGEALRQKARREQIRVVCIVSAVAASWLAVWMLVGCGVQMRNRTCVKRAIALESEGHYTDALKAYSECGEVWVFAKKPSVSAELTKKAEEQTKYNALLAEAMGLERTGELWAAADAAKNVIGGGWQDVSAAKALLARVEESKKKAVEQCRLGVSYEIGDGVGKDLKEAVNWYRKAAEHGNAEAQNRLGQCYANGLGVEEDLKQAVAWYRKAAEQGYAEAEWRLGICYALGYGVEDDWKQAAAWFRKAADQGYAAAQCSLGTCYAFGNGVETDLKQAVAWYHKAADQGYVAAQCSLGTCYAFGNGVEKDLKQAVAWYRRAADLGNAEAQWRLGSCYASGDGVEKDLKQAVAWYRKAADLGNAEAQWRLGSCYASAAGVTRDDKEAFTWYGKAAAQSHAEAMCDLALCYAYGKGVERNDDAASNSFAQAVGYGSWRARGCYEYWRRIMGW